MCDIADDFFSEKFTTIVHSDSECDVKYVVLLNLNYRYVVYEKAISILGHTS